MKSIFQIADEAMARHADSARQAYRLFVSYCGDCPPPRVPGMDTVLRLAIRIDCGKSIEEAAAREYFYRWSLALRSPIFGVPHAIGL